MVLITNLGITIIISGDSSGSNFDIPHLERNGGFHFNL